jgi:steroid delta-isomerase-like uncharacterized protein
MSEETENIALVRRYLQNCWTTGTCNPITDYFAEDFIAHDATQPADIRGAERAAHACEQFFQTFPVIEAHINHILADGDKVVVHWTHRGRHSGELLGIAPTFKEATLEGMAIFRLANGKIKETWEVANVLQMLHELGMSIAAH